MPEDDASSPPCDLDAEFGEAKAVEGIDGVGSMFLATLTADERTLYYDSNTVGQVTPQARMFRAQRNSRTEPFGPATNVVALSLGSAGRPTLSGDALSIVFFTDDPPLGLRLSTRSVPTAEFAVVHELSLRSQHGTVTQAALSFDGRSLYYAAKDGDAGVFASTRSGDDFPPGAPVPGLSLDDRPPHVVRDGAVGYFTRVTSDNKVVDIYHATRGPDGTFTNVTIEGPTINTADDEYVCFVSWDGCRLYFNRRRAQTNNGALLVAEKPARR